MLDSIVRRLDSFFMAVPDSTRWIEQNFSRTWTILAAILVATIITRASVFGDPNYHIDESYYFLVGQRMQAGDLLYVDIWDRKPPGLYLIYRALAELSHDFWIVHLAAGASAAATAYLVFRISKLIAPRQGALLAALCYLILLPTFAGAGGQSPVLYNLPMALAAWLILDHPARTPAHRRELLAMLSAGCAITIKQTALLEGVFMGLWLLWCHRSVGIGLKERWIRALQLVSCGALPTLAYFAWYIANGHFDILWQSVVESNLARQYETVDSQTFRLGFLTAQLSLPLGAALLSIALQRDRFRKESAFRFTFIWLAVAISSVLAVPNKFEFYVIPIILPLLIAGAPFLGRRDFGILTFAIAAVGFSISGNLFDFRYHRESRAEVTALSRSIQSSGDDNSFIVYGGPTFLYSMLNSEPPLELAFPSHLYELSEKNASPFNTKDQILKALSTGPRSIVVRYPIRSPHPNTEIDEIVESYTKLCGGKKTFGLRDYYSSYIVVHYWKCNTKLRGSVDFRAR